MQPSEINSFTHLMKVKHFFCKKSIDNAEFIILMGWVYVSENSFQLMLQSWLSNRGTQIQSHTKKMNNITYTWNKSCLLFYISTGKYCYKSSKQSIKYMISVFTLPHLIVCNQTEQLSEIKLSIESYQLVRDPY